MTPQQIRALRERLKMTQEEFAFRLGLKTRGAVSSLESGRHPPKGPLLRLLEELWKKSCSSLPGTTALGSEGAEAGPGQWPGSGR